MVQLMWSITAQVLQQTGKFHHDRSSECTVRQVSTLSLCVMNFAVLLRDMSKLRTGLLMTQKLLA